MFEERTKQYIAEPGQSRGISSPGRFTDAAVGQVSRQAFWTRFLDFRCRLQYLQFGGLNSAAEPLEKEI